jgi:hypothetical protein
MMPGQEQEGGLAGGGDYPGLMGMRHGLTGLGLGLLSGPGAVGWGNAMKGYEQGAAIDSRSADRRAQMAQQQQERMFQRQMQAARMGQQESQFNRTQDLHREDMNARLNKPVISYYNKGYDPNTNQPIPGARIFTPSTGTVREIPIEQAQALESAGVPTSQGQQPPSGGGLADQLGSPGQQPQAQPQVRQQFLDEAPESPNVEDRTRPAAPAQPAPVSTQDLIKQFQAKGIPMGPAMDAALRSHATHTGGTVADQGSGKMTEQQMKANLAATRMEKAETNMGQNDIQGQSYWGKITEKYGGDFQAAAQPEAFQKYQTNRDVWLEGLLRQESGAAVPETEVARYARSLFPQPGQSQKVVEEKRELRAAITKVMKRLAGQGYVSPDVVISEAKKEMKGGGGQDRYPFADQPAGQPAEQTPENNPNVPLPESALKTAARWAANTLPRAPVPSLSEMGRGVYEAGKGAAEVTRDAIVEGKDPSADPAAIGKVFDAAALLAPGSRIPSISTRAGTPASTAATKVIKEQATRVYEEVREVAKDMPLGAGKVGEYVHEKIVDALKDAPGEAVAGEVFSKLKLLKKANDVKDLVEMRQAMGELARTGRGSEVQTAKVAKQVLDQEIDQFLPGTAEKLATADKNFAISGQSGKVEKKIDKGNLTEKTFSKEAEKAAGVPYTSEAERVAYENYAKPGFGMGALKAASYADPTRHGMAAVVGVPAAIMSGGSTLLASGAGYGARKLYDRGMKRRANDISMAIRSQAPAGFIPGSPEATIAGVRNSFLPPASYYPLALSPPPRRRRED